MRAKIFVLAISASFVFVSSFKALAWLEPSHELMSRYGAWASILNAGDILKEIGLEARLEERLRVNLQEETALEWMARIGARREDEAIPSEYVGVPRKARSNNHFHNPLKGWSAAGLNDLVSGESSVLWAQDSVSQSTAREGDWSWRKVRYYFKAAIASQTEAERQANFARTFRGLGHQMHLIQDAAVPAHTRNDAHAEDALLKTNLFGGYYFESWAASKKHGAPLVEAFASEAQFPLVSLQEASPQTSQFRLVPISHLLDFDQYDGTNPSASLAIGLAEYSNANYFSDGPKEGTIFAAEKFSLGHKHYTPYPKKTSTDLPEYEAQDTLPETIVAPDGVVDLGFWIKKIRDGEGEGGEANEIKHFVKPTYFTRNVSDTCRDDFCQWVYRRMFYLDGECHADYAKRLVPRAVGYSASLLDYFFRGQLYVVQVVPSADIASCDFGNENDTGTTIDRVALLLQNRSTFNGTTEPLGEGILGLRVTYKTPEGNEGYSDALPIIVAGVPAIGSDPPMPVVFVLSNPIAPCSVRDLTYRIFFQGRLGVEEGAVIGRVIKGPALCAVTPEKGPEGTIVTLTGNDLPSIMGPFPTFSGVVRFNHDSTKPYSAEVLSSSDTEIVAAVPNTTALVKPGHGGLRVRDILPTGETVWSNPVSFFPIAHGVVKNVGLVPTTVTVKAIQPIMGFYGVLPSSISLGVLDPGASREVDLVTGFRYVAEANVSNTKDIVFLTPDEIDFVFEVQ